MDDYAYPAPDATPTPDAAGGPPAPHRRWPRVVGALGAAGGLAVGAAALAGAATQPGQAPAQTTTSSTVQPNPAPGPGPKGFRGAKGPGIHGEFVVPAPNGGYETIANQVGTVTAVSSTSITVKSEDGFERTYDVDENTVVDAGRDGIADVKKDDQVHVTAIVADNKARAVEVGDVTTLRQHREPWAPRPHKRPGG